MSLLAYSEYRALEFQWLSSIPAKWQAKRIRHLLLDGADGIKIGPFGSQLTSDMLVNEGFKVYGQENVIANDFTKGSRFITAKKFEEMAVYQIQPGDLLVTMMGTAGRCKTAPHDLQTGIMDSHLLRMRFRNEILSRFVEILVDSAKYIENQLKIYGKGSIMHGLNSSIVKELIVAVPSLAEQHQILRFLDHETVRIDALIAEQQRLIELLKEKRQAVISHAVTKGLDPSVPMKDSGVELLGEVPAHWEVLRLKNVSPEITVGIVVEPSKYYVDEGVPALRSLNVKPGYISKDQLVYISPEANEVLSKSKIYAGDLVAVRSGQPGTTAVVPKDLDRSNCIDLIIIRKPIGGCEKFLCWYLASDCAIRQFSEGSGGAIQQHFNISTAANIVVPNPEFREQEMIARFLDQQTAKLDELVAIAEGSIALLSERRSALISAAVTGKIDVRNWQPPSDESAFDPEVLSAGLEAVS